MIRALFDEQRIVDNSEAGLAPWPTPRRSPRIVDDALDEPANSVKTLLEYKDNRGTLLALVWGVLRPDGFYGLSGFPDPKLLLIAGELSMPIEGHPDEPNYCPDCPTWHARALAARNARGRCRWRP